MINILIRHRTRMLTISIGIVYLWFGALKFFPGVSPAEALAKETLVMLVFGLIPSHITYFTIALWEVSIGICLMLNLRKEWVIYAALIHIAFTFTPLFVLPAATFNQQVYSLTFAGQYIIKNLIIFSALLFILPKEKNPARVIS